MAESRRYMCVTLVVCVFGNVYKLAEGINSQSNETQASVDSGELLFQFDPPFVEGLVVNDLTTVTVQLQVNNLTDHHQQFVNTDGELLKIKVQPVHDNILDIVGNNSFILSPNSDNNNNCTSPCFSFTIRGLFLGRTTLKFLLQQHPVPTTPGEGEQDTSMWTPLPDKYQVAVVRPDRVVDKVFIGLVMSMVVLANVGMGCKVELEVVKEVLKRPIPPAIGFACQYIIMPLLSFGLVQAFGLTGGLALGFFATGCSPAGGSSNMYTYLLGGDVSLSVTMTLISVLASFGMMPLWLFSLGRLLLPMRVKIPFQNIIATLAGILIPVAIGILIQHKRPKWAKVVGRFLRPCFIGLLLIVFTFGVWTNLYIFKLISPLLILAACLLPYLAFLLSGLVAFVCRQPRNRVLTIAIETAIQNTGIPIILMKLSLPQPEADLSAVSPVAIACFMPLPLWIAITVMEIRKRCCKKEAKDENEDAEGASDAEEQEADIKGHGDNGWAGQEMDDVKTFPLDDDINAPDSEVGLLEQEKRDSARAV